MYFCLTTNIGFCLAKTKFYLKSMDRQNPQPFKKKKKSENVVQAVF